ncbi:MAG TPA: ABC transporter substrate-binding protein [Acidimicrobiia bacterium]|nr:ABC transporter substrate-binding protein [Acidimicrobiia bacterium]
MARRRTAQTFWLVGVLLVVSLIMAACGTATPDGTGPAGTGSDGTTDDGATGGDVPNPDTLVITVNDQPANLDPAAVANTDVGMNTIFNVYDRLLDIAADSADLVPTLATEVPSIDNGLISEDGLTYTFPLREGVTFHDGTDFTADDVKFSWDRVVEMDLPEGQSELFANIAETRVVDDFTFEVTLEQPDVSFLLTVASAPPASVVSPEAVEENGGVEAGQPNQWMATNMVGTGPYTMESWERGDRMTFDIFEDYWGEPPHLPVLWELIVDSPAAGLQAREYDIVDISPTDVPTVEGIPHAVIDTTLDLQVLQIGMNMNIAEMPEGDTIPPDFFQDVRIRQAFNYAFDYQGMIEGILGGIADRGSFVFPQGMTGYDPDAPIYEHDPEMAEQLFREAGVWDEGFTVSIASDQTHEAFTGAALTLKDSIEALNPNFHINVMAVPEARFDEILATDPLPVAMWSYTSQGYPSPIPYLLDSALPDQGYGLVNSFADGYSDPDRITELVNSARTELDDDARMEIFTELQQVLYEEAMWIMPAQEGAPTTYGDWMQNVVENPMWPRPNQRWAIYDK